MTILSREEAKKVLTKVVGMSKAEGCSVSLGGYHEGNIRYARNSVTTAGMVDNMSLSVSSNFGPSLQTRRTPFGVKTAQP